MNKRADAVELVAPAGSWSAAMSAVRSGADAVYFGTGSFSMRAWADNFDMLELGKIMRTLHDKHVKGYLALNVTLYEDDLPKAVKLVRAAREAGVDALIVWDMAALRIARDEGLTVHLSTQASVSNSEAFRFYSSLGVRRIVLARECSLEDMARINAVSREESLDCELECFVHGAMCSSISGRCYLSQDVFGTSANRGECIQPCRRRYRIIDVEDECEYVLGEDHVLSARDLCAIRMIDDLIDSGVSAFKIEGRMRPPEYVSRVTRVYREAIDACAAGAFTDEMKERLYGELESSVFSRGLSEGFYRTRAADLGATRDPAYDKVFLGEVRKFYGKISVAEIELMSAQLELGDELLIYGRRTPASFATVESMEREHRKVPTAGKGERVGVELPFTVRRGDKVFIWKEKPYVPGRPDEG